MVKTILADLCSTLYYYIGFGLLFGFVTMIALPFINEKGIKNTIMIFWEKLKTDRQYLFRFLFFVCVYMVLAKTLICRTIWQAPWENVIGEWGIYTVDGEINTEGLENVVMFIPVLFLYYPSFGKQYKGNTFLKMCLYSVKYAFLFSLFIECGQLFLRLGTFQLSDLAQNTLGGLLGGVIYFAAYNFKHRN